MEKLNDGRKNDKKEKSMNTGMIVMIAVVVILAAVAIGGYNKLVKQKITVEEAFSTMDIYLKKRFDLIPNLVETVKGYAKHEESTLEEIIGLRNGNYGGMSLEEKLENSNALSMALPKIMALAEAYPELKANQNFLDLSSQLERLENDIANARKYYNGAVRQYNISVQSVPTNLIASVFQFTAKPMYELEDDNQRENVQVKF